MNNTKKEYQRAKQILFMFSGIGFTGSAIAFLVCLFQSYSNICNYGSTYRNDFFTAAIGCAASAVIAIMSYILAYKNKIN